MLSLLIIFLFGGLFIFGGFGMFWGSGSLIWFLFFFLCCFDYFFIFWGSYFLEFFIFFGGFFDFSTIFFAGFCFAFTHQNGYNFGNSLAIYFFWSIMAGDDVETSGTSSGYLTGLKV